MVCNCIAGGRGGIDPRFADELDTELLTVSGKLIAKLAGTQRSRNRVNTGLLTTGPWCCPGEAAMPMYRIATLEQAGTDQTILLCDLCVSANFAIDLPEALSTCDASLALTAVLHPQCLRGKNNRRGRTWSYSGVSCYWKRPPRPAPPHEPADRVSFAPARRACDFLTY